MAATVLKPPSFGPLSSLSYTSDLSSKSRKLLSISFKQHRHCCRLRRSYFAPSHSDKLLDSRVDSNFLLFASRGEATETETETETETDTDTITNPDVHFRDNSDGIVDADDSPSKTVDPEKGEPVSVVFTLLQSYKEAIESNDESKIAAIESFLKSIEDEKTDLEKKVISISEELSYEKARILRISADFDNFRKRTERERLSLVTNAQGELVENLLPVLDNFERAKAQTKVETEGEEKINNSYQSIYKQFMEILVSLGVVPVETIGNPFDPMLHEAIMREESMEFEEGIILDEYRKGFKLGDRLLRPSMVKVSAGPGPTKPESVEPSSTLQGETEPEKDNEETDSAEDS